MATLENKETMQNCEATLKCLQSKGFPYNLQCTGNSIEGLSKLKDEICSHTGGDVVEPVCSLNGQFKELSNEFYHKPTLQHESGSWSTFYPDSHKLQLYPPNAFGSQFHQFPVDNRSHYPPYNMATQGYPYEFQFQDFQYFVVIDFEATCDKERNLHPQEIIEFPSVVVSSVTGQLEACFQTYVRPTCNQLLSDFCKDLTGIQQIQVDRGVTLSEALLRHDKWLEKKGIKNTNFAVVTWSNWDCRVMLESECQFKKIRKPPYFNRWINLKVPFREIFGGARCNLKEAVEMAGLVWQGRAHCGLDDAKNTARLLVLLMRQGFKFTITNSLMWQASDGPVTWNPIPENMDFSPHHPHKPKDQQMPLFQYHPYCFCGHFLSCQPPPISPFFHNLPTVTILVQKQRKCQHRNTGKHSFQDRIPSAMCPKPTYIHGWHGTFNWSHQGTNSPVSPQRSFNLEASHEPSTSTELR